MEDRTYINILTDTLRKKAELLDQLTQITADQEAIISSETPDMEGLENTFSKKEAYILKLNQLDDGFEKVYHHVREAFEVNKEQYKEQIINLQELIRLVTEKGARLQAMELRNKSRFQVFFSGKKKDIKNFKVSSRMANNYYKNVMNQQPGESFFVDKKN